MFDLVCFLIGGSIALSWFLTKNWVLNNILGVGMAIIFLKTIRLNKMMPGVYLLVLLFFYDIFWVFISQRFTSGGQSVMVAVATKFEAPIKLMFPHVLIDYPTANCSMIGLGDIVVPGIYIGFLVRFGRIVLKGYKGYTIAAFTAYAASLMMCGGMLIAFGVA